MKTNNRISSNVSVALAVSIALNAPNLKAQQLEEIVVTASKREQSVQDIPYNISVVTGDQLDKLGISDTNSLLRAVPGLTTFDEGLRPGGGRNNLQMRGMNVNNAGNEDDNPMISQATVSTYLGEVPLYFPMKLFDLNRVEVLRGPQGTLYGAGSVSGTVRFIPNKPSTEEESVNIQGQMSSTSHASDSSYDFNINANIPMSETTAFRGTFGYEKLSGFIDAIGLIGQEGTPRDTGAVILADPNDILGSPPADATSVMDSNEANITYIRASVLSKPSDTLEIGLNFNYQKIETDNRNEHNPNYGSGDNYVTYKAHTDPSDGEMTLIDIDVEKDLGFARLTSSTAVSSFESFSVSDSSGFLRTNLPQYYFGNPRVFSPIDRDQEVDTFTQELRLTSQSDGKVSWIGGLFYLKRDLVMDLYQPLIGVTDYTNAYFGTTGLGIDFTDVLAYGGVDQTFTDWSIFGEVSYQISDPWQVTVGFRNYDNETKGTAGIPLPYASRTFEFYYYGTASDDFLLGGFNPTLGEDDGSIIKLNTSYDVNDNTMVFATYAEGFRASGVNQLPEFDPWGTDYREYLTFKPDELVNFEFGVKGTLNDRFNYTLTRYDTDWEEFQMTLYSLFGIAFVDNVPSANSKGFEFELNGNVSDNFNINFGYSHADASITESFLYSRIADQFISAGARLPGSAENEMFMSGTYQLPSTNSGADVVINVNASYKGDVLSNFIESDANFQKMKSFTVWNTRVTWTKDNYSISVFGNNLSDELGQSMVSVADGWMGDRDQSKGLIRPRSIGIGFNYKVK
jgi:outer membrane receptor protein involved in Fe transport